MTGICTAVACAAGAVVAQLAAMMRIRTAVACAAGAVVAKLAATMGIRTAVAAVACCYLCVLGAVVAKLVATVGIRTAVACVHAGSVACCYTCAAGAVDAKLAATMGIRTAVACVHAHCNHFVTSRVRQKQPNSAPPSDPATEPTMPPKQVMQRTAGTCALSISLRNLPWSVKGIFDIFQRGVASCQNQAPNNAGAPPWQGAATWARMCKIINKERGWVPNFIGNSEGCFQVLKELAAKSMWDLKSHDLRIMLLLNKTCVSAFEVEAVQTLFCEEPHRVALSYQWAAPFREVFEGLSSVCSLDDNVWVDILFNPQGASLDSETVMQITRNIYLQCERHVLLVHEGQTVTGVLGRAWVALEVAVRASSREASMVELIDRHNSAEKYYQKSKMSVWQWGLEFLWLVVGLEALFCKHLEALLRKFYDFQTHDFFSSLVAHVAADLPLIEEAIEKSFKSKHFPDKSGAEMFNCVVGDFFRLAGGIQLIERLHSLPYHEGWLPYHEGDLDIVDKGSALSRELFDKGKYRESLRMRERQLESAVRRIGPESACVASILNNMGNTYERLGEYPQALEKLEESIRIYSKIYGAEHERVALGLISIGIVYKSLGDYAKALECHEKALAIFIKSKGAEHQSVAASLENIGIVYLGQGEYTLALEKHEAALRIRLKTLGDNHPDGWLSWGQPPRWVVAASLHNIGVVYKAQGKLEQALGKYQEALQIQLKTLGQDHPDVARTLRDIGDVYEKQGSTAQAAAKLEEAVRIRRKVSGEESEDLELAAKLDMLSHLYHLMGNTAAAEAKYEEASRIQKALLLGEDGGAGSGSSGQESGRAGPVQVYVGKPFLSPVDSVERTVRFHAFNTIRFMQPCPPNSKTYYELHLLAGVEAPQFGFVASKFEPGKVFAGRTVGDDAASWAVDGKRGLLWNDGPRPEKYAVTWKEGDVIGLGCDLEERQVLVAVNGDSSPPNGLVFQLDEEAVRDGMYAAFTAATGVVKFNFGEEHAMAHAWEGFEPLGRAVRSRQ